MTFAICKNTLNFTDGTIHKAGQHIKVANENVDYFNAMSDNYDKQTLFRVIFTYDEEARLWEAKVEGAKDKVEARQGFSAVVITCQQLDPNLLVHTKVDDNFNIIPAVR